MFTYSFVSIDKTKYTITQDATSESYIQMFNSLSLDINHYHDSMSTKEISRYEIGLTELFNLWKNQYPSITLKEDPYHEEFLYKQENLQTIRKFALNNSKEK